MTETIPRPALHIAEDTDPAMAARIRSIDRSFHESPQDFIYMIDSIGSLLTQSLVAKDDNSRFVPTNSKQPGALMQELIDNRYDLAYEYDEATQQSLEQDDTYQDYRRRLIDASRNKNYRPEITQGMRIHKLRYYLYRITQHQDEQTAESFRKTYTSA